MDYLLQQNLVIEYNSAGIFDVTLIVSNGFLYDTITLSDYITVSNELGAPPTPEGSNIVCGGTVSSSYTTTGLSGVSSYAWELEPFEAGEIAITGLTCEVDWNMDFLGDVNLMVAGVNVCGTGAFSNPLIITRYRPEVVFDTSCSLCVDWPSFELVGGFPEGGGYSGTGVNDGWFSPSLAGIGNHAIIYSYTDENNCENADTAFIEVESCSGLHDRPQACDVTVFPNPTNGKVYIKAGFVIHKIELVNLLGNVVLQSTINDRQTWFDSQEHRNGIYLLKIFIGNRLYIRKLLIE